MSVESEEKWTESEYEKQRPVWPRSRTANLPKIDKNLKEMYEKLKEGDYFFRKRTKTTRGLHNGKSSRRSWYVGVSRNRHHFQTLITTKRVK